MKIRKLIKQFNPETVIRVLTKSGELFATGVIEDFDESSKTLDKKISEVNLRKCEKFKDLEGSDYPYLEIIIND